MAAYKPKVGDVAYSKKGYYYVFLGYRVVACAYNTDIPLNKAKPQTVEIWFCHSHFPHCNSLGKPTTRMSTGDLQTEIQLWSNRIECSHCFDNCFISSVNASVTFININVDIDECLVVEVYKEKLKDVKGHRYEKEKHRAKYYLCQGEWSRKKIIGRYFKRFVIWNALLFFTVLASVFHSGIKLFSQ